MAPVQGIEPRSTVLETAVMPLYQTGTCLVGAQGFEPRMPKATDLQSAEVTNASRHPY